MTKQTIKERILFFLENQNKKSVSIEEIAQALHLNKSTDFKQLVQTIAAMEREELLLFTRKGKVRLAQQETTINGIFRGNERGFGFVTVDEEEADIYIPKQFTHYAMDGDEVAVDILQPANPFTDKGAEGKVVAVVKRAVHQLVGEFVAYDDEQIAQTDLYGYVLPKDRKLKGLTVFIAAQGIQPVAGNFVKVTITHYPDAAYPNSLEGLVQQVIGHKNDPGMDVLSVLVAHGIPTQFPQAVLDEAQAIVADWPAEEMSQRKDLRAEQIVTIDGADAKDLDDAVTVRRLTNGHFLLGVHIADVSYYVTEGSALDQEAYERGTSVYLTDRVVPMLPQRLSNDLCSLNPQVPRLTMSCEMEIDLQGNVCQHTIFPSVIQTSARMTYEEVNAILTDKNPELIQNYESLVPMFQEMQALHELLTRMRSARGAISFEDREATILVNQAGQPEELVLRTRGVGEKMIESFMLLANETVAKHYHDLKVPFLYRIHEQPKEEKMQRFFDFAATLGVLVKGTKGEITPKDLQHVLAQVKEKPEEMMIHTMMLRSMQQARYSEENTGHYGLAATDYTHFTSPIRRYPDLIVHRLIRAYQANFEQAKAKWANSLPEIAAHSSKMERRAVEAEREVNMLKKAEYMLEKIGETYEGVISSVTKFGFFVALPNTVEGLVHIQSLRQDYFHYLENHLALVGERTGMTLKIGQKVTIRVEKSDPETGEIDFTLLETQATAPIALATKGKKAKPTRKKAQTKEKRKGKQPFYKDVVKNKKKKNKNKKKK